MDRKKIAVQVHTHGHNSVTEDTVARVKRHLTENVVIICDRIGWKEIHDIKDTPKMYGLLHAHPNSPYRNQILGLSHLFRKHPDCTWYGNVEWDTAINNNYLLEDLEAAEKSGAWTAGFDMREFDTPWPVLSAKLGREITNTRYFIGCCLFFHHDFMKTCEEFFPKILSAARIYGPHWPDYREWSVDEALLPSLARSYNKPGFELGCWDKNYNRHKYAVRYKPQWEALARDWSVAHPLKDMSLRTP